MAHEIVYNVKANIDVGALNEFQTKINDINGEITKVQSNVGNMSQTLNASINSGSTQLRALQTQTKGFASEVQHMQNEIDATGEELTKRQKLIETARTDAERESRIAETQEWMRQRQSYITGRGASIMAQAEMYGFDRDASGRKNVSRNPFGNMGTQSFSEGIGKDMFNISEIIKQMNTFGDEYTKAIQRWYPTFSAKISSLIKRGKGNGRGALAHKFAEFSNPVAEGEDGGASFNVMSGAIEDMVNMLIGESGSIVGSAKTPLLSKSMMRDFVKRDSNGKVTEASKTVLSTMLKNALVAQQGVMNTSGFASQRFNRSMNQLDSYNTVNDYLKNSALGGLFSTRKSGEIEDYALRSALNNITQTNNKFLNTEGMSRLQRAATSNSSLMQALIRSGNAYRTSGGAFKLNDNIEATQLQKLSDALVQDYLVKINGQMQENKIIGGYDYSNARAGAGLNIGSGKLENSLFAGRSRELIDKIASAEADSEDSKISKVFKQAFGRTTAGGVATQDKRALDIIYEMTKANDKYFGNVGVKAGKSFVHSNNTRENQDAFLIESISPFVKMTEDESLLVRNGNGNLKSIAYRESLDSIKDSFGRFRINDKAVQNRDSFTTLNESSITRALGLGHKNASEYTPVIKEIDFNGFLADNNDKRQQKINEAIYMQFLEQNGVVKNDDGTYSFGVLSSDASKLSKEAQKALKSEYVYHVNHGQAGTVGRLIRRKEYEAVENNWQNEFSNPLGQLLGLSGNAFGSFWGNGMEFKTEYSKFSDFAKFMDALNKGHSPGIDISGSSIDFVNMLNQNGEKIDFGGIIGRLAGISNAANIADKSKIGEIALKSFGELSRFDKSIADKAIGKGGQSPRIAAVKFDPAWAKEKFGFDDLSEGIGYIESSLLAQGTSQIRGGLAAKGMLNSTDGLIRSLATNFGGKTIELNNGGKRYTVEMPSLYGGTTELIAEYDKDNQLVGSNYDAILPGSVIKNKDKIKDIYSQKIATGASEAEARKAANFALSALFGVTGIDVMNRAANDADTDNIGVQAAQWIQMSPAFMKHQAEAFAKRKQELYTPQGLIRLFGGMENIDNNEMVKGLAGQIEGISSEQFMIENSREINNKRNAYLQSLQKQMAFGVIMDLDSRTDKKSDAQMLNLIENEKGGEFTSKYQMTSYKNQRLVTNPYMVKLAELGVYEDEKNKKLWTEALNSIDLSQQGGKLEDEALEKAYNAFKEKGGKSSIDFSKFSKEKFASSIETLQGFRKTLNDQFGNEVFGNAGIDPEKLLGILTMTGFGKEGDKYQLGKGAIDFDNMNQAMLGIIRSPTGFGQIIGRTNYASFLAPILAQLGITGQKGLYLNYSDMQRISGADWDGDMIKSVLSKKYDIEKLSSMSTADIFKWMADSDVSGGLNALRKSGDVNSLKRSNYKTDIEFLNAIERASNNSSLVDDIINTEQKVEALKLYTSLDKLKEEVDAKVNNTPITNVSGETGNQKLDEAALLQQIKGLTMAQVKMGGGSGIGSRLSSLNVYSPDNAYWARLAAEGNNVYDIFTTDAKKPTTTKLTKNYLQALGLGAEWGKMFGMIGGANEFNQERIDENTMLFSTKDGKPLTAKDITLLSNGMYMRYDSEAGISKKAANGGFTLDETQFMSHNNKQHMMATLESLTAEQMGINDSTWADYFSEGFTKAANYKKDKNDKIITSGKFLDTIAEKADIGSKEKSGAGGGMGYGLFDYMNWIDAEGNERQGLSDVVALMQNARWIKGQQAGGSHMVISSEERNILALQALAARKQIEEVTTAAFRDAERDEYGNAYIPAKNSEGNDIQLTKEKFAARLRKQAGIPVIEMMLGGHKVEVGNGQWRRISTGVTEDQLLTMLDSENATNRFLAASILKNYTPANRVDLANFKVDNNLKDQQYYVRSVNGSSAGRTWQRLIESGIDPEKLFNPDAKKEAADILAGKLEDNVDIVDSEEIRKKVDDILENKEAKAAAEREITAASRLSDFIAIGDRIRSGEKATVFDLETTGTNTSKDQITQISSALLGVKDYYGNEWNTYVRPNKSQLAEKKEKDLQSAQDVTGINFEELMSKDSIDGVKVLDKATALESFKKARRLSEIGIGFNNTKFDDKVLNVQAGHAGVADIKFKTSVDVLDLLETLGQADVRVEGTNIIDYYKEKIAKTRAGQVQKEFIDKQMQSEKMQFSKKEYEDSIKSIDEDTIFNNEYLDMIVKSENEYKKTYDKLMKNPLLLNINNELVGGTGSHKLTTLAGAMLNLPTEALTSNGKAHNSSYDVDMTSALYANLMSKAYDSIIENSFNDEEIANAKAGKAYFNNIEAKIKEKILGQEQFKQTEAEIDKAEVDRIIAERQEMTKQTNKLYGQGKINAEKREEQIAAQVTPEVVKDNPPAVVEDFFRSLDAFVPKNGYRETTTGDGKGVPNKEEPKISTMRSYFQKTGNNIEEKAFSTLMDDITNGLNGAIEGYQGDKKDISELKKQYDEAVKNGQYGIALETINGIQSVLGNNGNIDNNQVGQLAKYINAERTAVSDELAASGKYDHISPLYNPGVKTLEAARIISELEEDVRKDVVDKGLISIKEKNAEGKEVISSFKVNPEGMVEVANEATANMQWFIDMNQQLSDVRKNNSKANYNFTEDRNIAIANKSQAIQDYRLKNMMKMRSAALEIITNPDLAGIRDSQAGLDFTDFVLDKGQGGMMDQYLKSIINEVKIAPDVFNRDMNSMMAKESATGTSYLRYQALLDKQTTALEELKARETALNTLFTTTTTNDDVNNRQNKIVANIAGGTALISGAREQLMKAGFNNIPDLNDLDATADYTDVYNAIKKQIEESKKSISGNTAYRELSKLMIADMENASTKETTSAMNRFYGISKSSRPSFDDRVISLQNSMMSDVLSRRTFFDNLDNQNFDYSKTPKLAKDKKALEELELNIKNVGGYQKWAEEMARRQEEQYNLNEVKYETKKNAQIDRLIERDNYQTKNRYLGMLGNNLISNALKNQISYKHQLTLAGEQLSTQLESAEAEYTQDKTDYEGKYKQKLDELIAVNKRKRLKNRLTDEQLEEQARQAVDSTKMDSSKARLDKLSKQSDLNKKRQDNATGLKGFATSFAIIGIQQLINSLTKGITALKQFQQQWETTMAAVSAKSGLTGKELDNLESKITSQATKLKTSVTNLANTYKELFASGFDASNIEAAAEAVTKFATVTGQNATKSMKQLTQIVNSGLVSSLEEAMDMLTAVSDLSVASSSDITKVLNKMTGTSKSSGTSTPETVALATFATEIMGGSASAGNDLGIILSRINSLAVSGSSGSTTYKTSEGTTYSASNLRALENVTNIKFLNDGTNTLLSSFDILQNIAEQWQNLTDGQRNIFTTMFGGTTGRQANTFTNMMNAWSLEPEKMTEFLNAAKNSEGTVDKQYETMTDTFNATKQAAIDAFKSFSSDKGIGSLLLSFEKLFYKGVLSTFGNTDTEYETPKTMQESLNEVVSSIDDITSKYSDMADISLDDKAKISESIQGLLTTFPELADVIGTTTVNFENLNQVMSNIKDYQGLLNYREFTKSYGKNAYSDALSAFEDSMVYDTVAIINNIKPGTLSEDSRNAWLDYITLLGEKAQAEQDSSAVINGLDNASYSLYSSFGIGSAVTSPGYINIDTTTQRKAITDNIDAASRLSLMLSTGTSYLFDNGLAQAWEEATKAEIDKGNKNQIEFPYFEDLFTRYINNGKDDLTEEELNTLESEMYKVYDFLDAGLKQYNEINIKEYKTNKATKLSTDAAIWGMQSNMDYEKASDLVNSLFSTTTTMNEISIAKANEASIGILAGNIVEKLTSNITGLDDSVNTDIYDIVLKDIKSMVDKYGIENLSQYIDDRSNVWGEYLKSFMEGGALGLNTEFDNEAWRNQEISPEDINGLDTSGIKSKYRSTYYYLNENNEPIYLTATNEKEALADAKKKLAEGTLGTGLEGERDSSGIPIIYYDNTDGTRSSIQDKFGDYISIYSSDPALTRKKAAAKAMMNSLATFGEEIDTKMLTSTGEFWGEYSEDINTLLTDNNEIATVIKGLETGTYSYSDLYKALSKYVIGEDIETSISDFNSNIETINTGLKTASRLAKGGATEEDIRSIMSTYGISETDWISYTTDQQQSLIDEYGSYLTSNNNETIKKQAEKYGRIVNQGWNNYTGNTIAEKKLAALIIMTDETGKYDSIQKTAAREFYVSSNQLVNNKLYTYSANEDGTGITASNNENYVPETTNALLTLGKQYTTQTRSDLIGKILSRGSSWATFKDYTEEELADIDNNSDLKEYLALLSRVNGGEKLGDKDNQRYIELKTRLSFETVNANSTMTFLSDLEDTLVNITKGGYAAASAISSLYSTEDKVSQDYALSQLVAGYRNADGTYNIDQMPAELVNALMTATGFDYEALSTDSKNIVGNWTNVVNKSMSESRFSLQDMMSADIQSLLTENTQASIAKAQNLADTYGYELVANENGTYSLAKNSQGNVKINSWNTRDAWDQYYAKYGLSTNATYRGLASSQFGYKGNEKFYTTRELLDTASTIIKTGTLPEGIDNTQLKAAGNLVSGLEDYYKKKSEGVTTEAEDKAMLFTLENAIASYNATGYKYSTGKSYYGATTETDRISALRNIETQNQQLMQVRNLVGGDINANWDNLNSEQQNIVASYLNMSVATINKNKTGAQAVLDAKTADNLKEVTEAYKELDDAAKAAGQDTMAFAIDVNSGEIDNASDSIKELAASYVALGIAIDEVADAYVSMRIQSKETAKTNKSIQDFYDGLEGLTESDVLSQTFESTEEFLTYLRNFSGLELNTEGIVSAFAKISDTVEDGYSKSLNWWTILQNIMAFNPNGNGLSESVVDAQYNSLMSNFTLSNGQYIATEEQAKAFRTSWNQLSDPMKEALLARNSALADLTSSNYTYDLWRNSGESNIGIRLAAAEREYNTTYALNPLTSYAERQANLGNNILSDYGIVSAIQSYYNGDKYAYQDVGEKYGQLKIQRDYAAGYLSGKYTWSEIADQFDATSQKDLDEKIKKVIDDYTALQIGLNVISGMDIEGISDFTDSVYNVAANVQTKSDQTVAQAQITAADEVKTATILNEMTTKLTENMSKSDMYEIAKQYLEDNYMLLSANDEFLSWMSSLNVEDATKVAADYYDAAMASFNINQGKYGRVSTTFTNAELESYFNQIKQNGYIDLTNSDLSAAQREDLKTALGARYGSDFINTRFGQYNTGYGSDIKAKQDEADIRAAELNAANADIKMLFDSGIIGQQAYNTLSSINQIKYGTGIDVASETAKLQKETTDALLDYNEKVIKLNTYNNGAQNRTPAQEEAAKRDFLSLLGINNVADNELETRFNAEYNTLNNEVTSYTDYYNQMRANGGLGYGYDSELIAPIGGYTWKDITTGDSFYNAGLGTSAGMDIVSYLESGNATSEGLKQLIEDNSDWSYIVNNIDGAADALAGFARGEESAATAGRKLKSVLKSNAAEINALRKNLVAATVDIANNQHYINKYNEGTLTKTDKDEVAQLYGLTDMRQADELGISIDEMINALKMDNQEKLDSVNDELSSFFTDHPLIIESPDVEVVDTGTVTFDSSTSLEELQKYFQGEQLEAIQKAIAAQYVLTFSTTTTTDENGATKEVAHLFQNATMGSALSGGVKKSSGGGSGKSASAKLLEKWKRNFEIDKHQINMVKAQEEKYKTQGNLASYGNMIELENVAQTKQISRYKKAISEIKKQMGTVKKNSDDWYDLRDAVFEYEEAIEDCKNAIIENNKALKENREAMRQTRTELENMIKDAIEANEEFEDSKLAGTVNMQDVILDALRQRYQSEWDLMKEDLQKKRDALEEEKNLINERLQARKDAESEASEYEQLAELQKQLALISMDTTMSKEAADLRAQIAEKQNALAWKQAEESTNAATEALDEQINGIDQYMTEEDERVAKYLEDANNFADQVAEVLGMSSDEIMTWLADNVEEYGNLLDTAQKQQVESWLDTYKQMMGITDLYWTMINSIIDGGWGDVMAYMQTTQEYQNASATGKLEQIYSWQTAFDEYTNAFEGTQISKAYDEYMAIIEKAVDNGDEDLAEKYLNGYIELMNGSAKYSHTDTLKASDGTVTYKIASGTEHISANTDIIVSTLKNVDKLANLLNSDLARYADGGVNTTPGLAWLDGTMSNPEYIFNSEQMKALSKTGFMPFMSQIGSDLFGGSSSSMGDVIVTINQAEISSDYDVERLASLVGDKFVEQISTQGYRTSRF